MRLLLLLLLWQKGARSVGRFARTPTCDRETNTDSGP